MWLNNLKLLLFGRQGQDRAAAGNGSKQVGGHAGINPALRQSGAHAHHEPDERGRHCVHSRHDDWTDPVRIRSQPGVLNDDVIS